MWRDGARILWGGRGKLRRRRRPAVLEAAVEAAKMLPSRGGRWSPASAVAEQPTNTHTLEPWLNEHRRVGQYAGRFTDQRETAPSPQEATGEGRSPKPCSHQGHSSFPKIPSRNLGTWFSCRNEMNRYWRLRRALPAGQMHTDPGPLLICIKGDIYATSNALQTMCNCMTVPSSLKPLLGQCASQWTRRTVGLDTHTTLYRSNYIVE